MRPIPEKLAAKATGEMYYTVEKPCANGHSSKRYTRTGRCVECISLITKRYWSRKPKGVRYAQVRQWISKNKKHVNKKNAEWRAKNPDKVREYQKKTWLKHGDKYKALQREKNRKNRAKIRKQIIRWEKNNPEKAKENHTTSQNNHRTRKKQNGGKFSVYDLRRMKKEQKNRCAACGEQRKLTVDHIIPIVKGGSSDPSNLQLLCKPCNTSKGAKDYTEWLAIRLTIQSPAPLPIM